MDEGDRLGQGGFLGIWFLGILGAGRVLSWAGYDGWDFLRGQGVVSDDGTVSVAGNGEESGGHIETYFHIILPTFYGTFGRVLGRSS